MRFYILGNWSEEFSCTPKRASYQTTDLDEALFRFDKYAAEARYNHMYLVVDFEYQRQSILGSSIKKDYSENLPFFVLSEYHYGDINDIARHDTTVIYKKGFEHEFCNNIVALKEFLYCCDNNVMVDWNIRYIKVDNNGVCRLFERKIVSTIDIKDGGSKKIRRFRIRKNQWSKAPQIEKHFNIYDLKKNRKIENDGIKTVNGVVAS